MAAPSPDKPSDSELRRLYVDEKRSTRDIGAMFGVKHITIRRWLGRANIPLRPSGPPDGLAARGVEPPSAYDLWMMLHVDHLGYRGIADRYGVRFSAVVNWVKKAEVRPPEVWETRRKGARPAEIDAEEAVCLYQAGISITSIARRYGVSSHAVRAQLAEADMPVRSGGWNGGIRYACSDGHQVRSIYERRVDDWLSENELPHENEPGVPGSTMFRSDFLVGDVFIEVWGVTGSKIYNERKSRKLGLYVERGLKLVQLNPWDFDRRRRNLWERKLSISLLGTDPRGVRTAQGTTAQPHPMLDLRTA